MEEDFGIHKRSEARRAIGVGCMRSLAEHPDCELQLKVRSESRRIQAP
jgi:hypothetical protein